MLLDCPFVVISFCNFLSYFLIYVSNFGPMLIFKMPLISKSSDLDGEGKTSLSNCFNNIQYRYIQFAIITHNTYKSYKMTLIGNDILDIGTRKWESVQKQQPNFLMGRGLDGDLISLPGTLPQPQTFDLPPVPNVSSLIKL